MDSIVRIFITGISGFIGFHTAMTLSKNHSVFGVDDFNDSYDVSLKRERQKILEENEIDEEKVISVAKLANIHDFILTLPDKYETSLGRGGSRLSGGQKQRIAIARALFRKSKILILDEATSNLDNKTESKIVESIKKLRGKVTTIIVSHRLSVLNDCDEIYEIKNKKLIQTIQS